MKKAKGFMNPLAWAVATLLPKLAAWLGLHLIRPESKDFFVEIAHGVIKQRYKPI